MRTFRVSALTIYPSEVQGNKIFAPLTKSNHGGERRNLLAKKSIVPWTKSVKTTSFNMLTWMKEKFIRPNE